MPVTNISEMIAISEPLVPDVTAIIAAVPTKKRDKKPLSDEAKAIKDQDKKDKQEKLKQDKQVAKRAKLNNN